MFAAVLAVLLTSGAGPWDVRALQETPVVHEASELAAEGVRSIFYEGLPWKGKETRVFAYLGVPEHAPGEKVPGVVLAHGGGGTAYDEWVRIWNQRGYAAIAMDLEGRLPQGEYPDRPTHAWSGPMRTGGLEDLEDAPEDQWYFHAVADIVLGNSLLRSLPEVDANRVGLTGISWGGILSSTVAGVDDRFAFVIPVYGCGFLNEAPVFQKLWDQLGPEKTQRWHDLWDGASYLANAKMPMLWVNGTNDLHFPLNIHSKSYALPQGPKTLSVRVGMKHSHPDGWKPEEIYVFADSVVKGGEPLPPVWNFGGSPTLATVSFGDPEHSKAELIYTTDTSDWVNAKWETLGLPGADSAGSISAPLPEGCKAWFVNITDKRGFVASTPVQVVE